MENIINVAFADRKTAYVEGLTQWDKGYLLKVTGIEDLDGIVEVHFSLNEAGGEAKRALAVVENGTLTVEIANFILQSEEIINYNAYAFIYPTDGDKAKTVRKIVFAIEARPKPADWVEETTSSIGKNSFVANDIKNNKALSPNSTALGGKTTAGGMGYKVIGVLNNEDGTGTYTLGTIEGLETGMSYSIRLKQGQQCNVGKITAIDTESKTVTVDNYYHMDLDGGADNPEEFTIEDYLTIVGRPDLGDVNVGFNALAVGENCFASDRDTVAFGRDVKVLGQYGFGAGRNLLVTYGATAIGMNCNALGLFSQTLGADLIATGYGQCVTGYNNIEDVAKRYLRIVGNGKNEKSNAYTLDLDGVGWFAGGLKIGGKSQDDGEDVATEKYVEDYVNPILRDIQTAITDIQNNIIFLPGDFVYKYISIKYNEEISKTKIEFLKSQGHFSEKYQTIQVCNGYNIKHSVAPAKGTYTFSINAKSEGVGNGIIIILDGREIFNTVLENTTEFADLSLGEITLDGKYHEVQIYATGSYAGIGYKYFELIPVA